MNFRQGRASLEDRANGPGPTQERTNASAAPGVNLAGGVFGGSGWGSLFGVGAGSRFVLGQVEICAEGIEDDHGQFVAEGIELTFGPTTVKTRRSADVFRESLAVVAFANQDVANEASGMNVVHAPAGLAAGRGETKKDFANSAELGAVVPSLGSVDFRMMPFRARGGWLLVSQLLRRIEVQDPLAGVTDDSLVSGTHLVIGLRAEHHPAGHAFLVANFGDPAASKLRDALEMAQQVFANAGAETIAFGSPLSEKLFILGGALAGLFLFFLDLGGFGLKRGLRSLDFLVARVSIHHQFEDFVLIGGNFLLRELDLV